MEWYSIAAYFVNQAIYSFPHSLITIGCQIVVVMGFFFQKLINVLSLNCQFGQQFGQKKNTEPMWIQQLFVT